MGAVDDQLRIKVYVDSFCFSTAVGSQEVVRPRSPSSDMCVVLAVCTSNPDKECVVT